MVERRAFAKKDKAIVVGEEMTKSNRPASRGTGDGAVEQTRCLNWGSSRPQPIRDRRAKTRWTKKISQREPARVSDEAIVSDELGGQHNLLGSQGPLDRVVRATRSVRNAFGLQDLNTRTLAAYKRRDTERMRVSRLTSVSCRYVVVKVSAESRFEAVLGKTRRTEFQRGCRKRALWENLEPAC